MSAPYSPLLPTTLPLRAKLIQSLRRTFDEEGFIEVETPVRIYAPANEPHIRPPLSGDAFLRASPELQMKRLLAAGLPKIYQIGPCFREGESGTKHAPEFTMLEWYRSNSDYREILADTKKLLCNAARTLNDSESAVIEFQGKQIDLAAPWLELTVRQAFMRYAGWDPLREWNAERFDEDMALQVEPALPKDRPVVLIDYPRQAASLAKLSDKDPRVAERWELYVGGIELANAFSELTDASEQRARFELSRAEKQALGEPDFALDEEFLSALEKLPPSGGIAVGVDRLVMVLLDLPQIAQTRPLEA